MASRARDLLIVLGLFVSVVLALSFGYATPILTTVLLTMVVVVTMRAWNSREDVMLGLTGIVVGPAIEVFAVSSGLWRYTSPSIAGLPLWVAPMWWIYGMTVARLTGALTGESIASGRAALPAAVIAIEVPWLCMTGSHPLLALGGVIVLLIAYVWRHHTRNDITLLIVCGMIGPAAELIPMRMGAWSYPSGPLLGLPLWLPAGYGVFGSALIQLGLSLSRGRAGAMAEAIQPLRQLHDAKPEQRVAGWQP